MVSNVLLGLTVANKEVKSGDRPHGLPHLMAGRQARFLSFISSEETENERTTDLCFARKSKQRDTEKLE